jgi:putative ABC transport system substrate-binding protein
MNNRRKLVIALGAGALVAPLASFAQQQPAKIARIGFLSSESASDVQERSRVEALREGLRELGYAEGKNFAIEFRWAEGKYDQLSSLATELARLRVDVLVTFGIKAAVAAKGATTTIPIVIPGTVTDLVAMGVVSSLGRPGGNITGSAAFGPEIMAKRLEMLRDAMPRITRVAVLFNPANSSSGRTLQAMEITARSLKLSLQPFEVRSPDEFEGIIAAMVKRRADAIVVQDDTMLSVNAKGLADLAAKKRLPSAGAKAFGEAGGLIGYGANLLEMYRRAAVYVDKILKGANPGDLPIDRATRFELVINLKTAKALGIKIPNSILVRADKVIE